MANAVVAVFDEYNEAEGALNELLVSGFDQQAVRLSGEKSTGAVERAERPRKEGVKGWFASLFGTERREDDFDIYDEAVKHGNYVVTAIAEDDIKSEIATEVFRHHHPIDLDRRASEWLGTSGRPTDAPSGQLTDTETRAIPIVEEQLKVGKREVERGGVRIYQRISETPVQEELRLKEEHVTVDRVPVNRPASQGDLDAFQEGTMELRETAEEAVIEKTAHVVEEVRIGRETSERTQQIRDTVRRTDVDVERLGAEDFRSHWQENYAALGSPYDDYAPAYDYGSQAARKYPSRDWDDVEPDLRRDWETKNPNSAWERFKDSIRYAFTGKRR